MSVGGIAHGRMQQYFSAADRYDWSGLDSPADPAELILRPADEAGGTGTEMMENRELTMDDYLAMLRRRMKVILIPALLAPLAGFLVSYAFSAKYTSQSLVLVDAAEDSRCGGAAGVHRRSDATHYHDPAEVLSPSQLRPMVEKLGLARGGQSVDDVIGDIQLNMTIEPVPDLSEFGAGKPQKTGAE